MADDAEEGGCVHSPTFKECMTNHKWLILTCPNWFPLVLIALIECDCHYHTKWWTNQSQMKNKDVFFGHFFFVDI